MRCICVIIGLTCQIVLEANAGYSHKAMDQLVDKLFNRLVGMSSLFSHEVRLVNMTLGMTATYRRGHPASSHRCSELNHRGKPLTQHHIFAYKSRYGYTTCNSMVPSLWQTAAGSPPEILPLAVAVAAAAAAATTAALQQLAPHLFEPDLGSNALLMQDGLPRFNEIKTRDVQPGIQKTLDDTMSEFKSLESEIAESKVQGKSESYARTIERIEKIVAPLRYAWSAVNHLLNVRNSNELQQVCQAVMPKVNEVEQYIGRSRPLYDALRSIHDNATSWASLTEPQRRIVSSRIMAMKLEGAELEAEQKEEFSRLKLEAEELSAKFAQNVMDSTNAFTRASAQALATKTSGFNSAAVAEAGLGNLSLDGLRYIPLMKNLEDRALRERLYRAHITRASEGETDNSGIILRILQLRRKMAHMLGHQNWAEVSLLNKMAPSVEAVTAFIDMLREQAYPAAQRELAELQDFAEKEYHFKGQLQHWDVLFFSERLREKLYSFTDEGLREYFPLEAVLQGLFELSRRLFDITITSVTGEEEVWHPDVRFFKVFDANSGQHIASFFLDPYVRTDKFAGSWMVECSDRSKVMGTMPVAYLACDVSPPTETTPALMTFAEVQALYHEFGHGLQHMLTAVEDRDVAGTHGIEWDAVELPSTFMENWCYDERTVMSFAKHYKTGERLPTDLFNKIREAKHFQASMKMLDQVYKSQLDLALHDNFDPNAETSSPFALQKRVADQYQVLRPLEEDRFLCCFSHMFGGEYDAGYYSYKWAEILSADSFAAFEEVGLNNDQEVRRVGRRFRDTVLSMGGGKHPTEVFKAFRGRDPLPDAVLRHSGLATVH